MDRGVQRFNGSELLFLLFFEVGTAANTYGIPGENNMLRALLFIGGLVCLPKVFKTGYTKRQILILAGLLTVAACIFLKASELSPFVTIAVLLVSKGIRFDRLINVTLCTKVLLVSARLACIVLGLTENEVISFWRNDGFISRYKFGYSSPNAMQMQITVITLLLIYKLHKAHFAKKSSFLLLHLGLFAVNFCFYRYTVSRTSFFTAVMLILISMAARRRAVSDALCRLAPLVMPFWMFFSFAGMVLPRQLPFINRLDTLLSGRLWYSYYLLHRFGLPLFGADISSTNVIYDNSYTRILINLGLFYAVFVFASMYKITKISSRQKDTGMVLLLIGYQTLAVGESIYGYVFSNLTLILAGSLIYKGREAEKHEENHNRIHSDVQPGGDSAGAVSVAGGSDR